MQKKFRALRLVSALFRLFSFILVLVALISFVGALLVAILRPESLYPTNIANGFVWLITGGSVSLLGGILIALLLYAVGSLIDVQLAIEENTRYSALQFKRLSERLASTEGRSARRGANEAYADPLPSVPPASAPVERPVPASSSPSAFAPPFSAPPRRVPAAPDREEDDLTADGDV